MEGTLIPAYGRDYKSKAEFLADWNAGKDFSLQSYNQRGGYCSAQDFTLVGTTFQVRWKKLTMVGMITLGKDGVWK